MKIEIFGVKNKTAQKTYRALARKVLHKLKSRIPVDAQVINIIIVTNQHIQKLNKKFLHKNRPTDVISFPLNEKIWGEIYISRERASTQAKERKITPKQEICNLIVHGILHLANYSHAEMRKIQIAFK